MTPFKTLVVIAALGMTTAACQTDMASMGEATDAAATLGPDATGYKAIEQIPGNASHPNQPGIPGESTTPTRSPGARENSTITP
jgi:hypothetical protein